MHDPDVGVDGNALERISLLLVRLDSFVKEGKPDIREARCVEVLALVLEVPTHICQQVRPTASQRCSYQQHPAHSSDSRLSVRLKDLNTHRSFDTPKQGPCYVIVGPVDDVVYNCPKVKSTACVKNVVAVLINSHSAPRYRGASFGLRIYQTHSSLFLASIKRL